MLIPDSSDSQSTQPALCGGFSATLKPPLNRGVVTRASHAVRLLLLWGKRGCGSRPTHPLCTPRTFRSNTARYAVVVQSAVGKTLFEQAKPTVGQRLPEPLTGSLVGAGGARAAAAPGSSQPPPANRVRGAHGAAAEESDGEGRGDGGDGGGGGSSTARDHGEPLEDLAG